MKKATHLIPLTLILLVLHQPALAQVDGRHEIKGTVFAPGNTPVPQSLVLLEDRIGRQLDRTYTDNDGHYIFGRLARGIYRIVVPEMKEYAQAWQEIEISGSKDAIIIRTVNIFLKLKGGKAVKAPRGTVVFTQDVPRAAEEEYKKGLQVLENGAREKGIAHLKQAIEIFPDYYLALARLGIEYAKAGDFGNAVPILARACRINSRSVTSHVTLGMSLVELGQFELAIQALTVGKSLDPQSVNAHLYLGIAHLQVGELKLAEENLQRAYELGGAERAATAHLYLASVYDQQSEFNRAADELEAYLRDAPKAKNADKLREAIKRLRRKNSLKNRW